MNKSQSPELSLSPELLQKLHERWGLVYAAIDNVEQSRPTVANQPVVTNEAENNQLSPETSGKVINLADYRDQQSFSEHAQRLAQLAHSIDQIHAEQPNPLSSVAPENAVDMTVYRAERVGQRNDNSNPGAGHGLAA
jgi:hypothetical protein